MAAATYWIFLVLGALFLTGVASRLLLWLTKKVMGDTYQSVWVSHALAYGAVAAVVAQRRGAPLGETALTYLLPILFWAWLGLSALKRRRAELGVFD